MDSRFLMVSIPLAAGYMLDLLLGDPRWLPHPVRLFGNMIAKGSSLLNKGRFKLYKGLLLTLLLCIAVFVFFGTCQFFLFRIHPVYYFIFSSVFVFYGLANKSLLQEGREVLDEMQHKGLAAGRKRLSWIVGRDTAGLSENQVKVAVLETLSENLSDGVVAPLFYYAIGGLPAMMTYKMVNTLDSMIGYKNERYFLFGKSAARLDDVLNFIPARITAVLMVLVTCSKRGCIFVYKYGNRHASPNSGYPEAALAGILDCRFGGPNLYQGVPVHKPFIGNRDRIILQREFNRVLYINHACTLLMVAGIILLYLLIQ